MKKYIPCIFFSFFLSLSCFAQEGNIQIENSPLIAQLIDLKSEMTQNNAFGERYKIQIFYGNNSEATNVLQEFRAEHPNWPTTIEYQAPNYKVWVGDFRNRLEADRAFMKIKNDFGSAFIFKPKGK